MSQTPDAPSPSSSSPRTALAFAALGYLVVAAALIAPSVWVIGELIADAAPSLRVARPDHPSVGLGFAVLVSVFVLGTVIVIRYLRSRRIRWTLTLLTVVIAAIVFLVALVVVISSAVAMGR